MIISPDIFSANLKCQMKCWLRAIGEHPAGDNKYAEWVHIQTESYREEGAKRLLAQIPSGDCAFSPCNSPDIRAPLIAEDLKATQWQLAVNVLLVTNQQVGSIGRENASQPSLVKEIVAPVTNQRPDHGSACVIENRLHAIERISSKGRGKATQFIPIRFTFQNKLDSDERMLLAFDALVLSEVLGRPIAFGKIIHGDKYTTVKVKTSGMNTQVQARIKKIISLLSSLSPPDLSLNRHCPECEFQNHCKKIATEKDDLSLLSNMSEKERQKFRSKGIFTVTQLSYTFRPRRRAKNYNDNQEKFHPSLKALAIREKKVHVVGKPELKAEGTPVYLDVEGLPDRDSYYLIGMRIGSGQTVYQHSLWANEINGERRVWMDFMGILASIDNPVLIHYGSYETTFLNRMRSRYDIPPEYSVLAAVFEQAINLVSVIYAKVYFPTYSNGLKDIAHSLGFTWLEADANGLTSIVWRCRWEISRSDELMQNLINYNAEDCAALELVAVTVHTLFERKANPIISGEHDFIDVDSLKREKIYPLGRNSFALPALEQINKAGYWEYQRNRIYLKTDKRAEI